MKFATALGEELMRLGPLGGHGASSGSHAGDPGLSPLPAPTQPRGPELPSYLQSPASPMPVAPVTPPASVPPPLIQARMDAEPASRSDLGGTANMDLSAIVAAVKRGSMPFKPTGGSSPPPPLNTTGPGSEVDLAEVPLLPLETYASVTGALARGEARDEVLARHGLSADTYAKMARGWTDRFGRDPHLLATFQELARNSAASPRRSE